MILLDPTSRRLRDDTGIHESLPLYIGNVGEIADRFMSATSNRPVYVVRFVRHKEDNHPEWSYRLWYLEEDWIVHEHSMSEANLDEFFEEWR